MSFFYRPFTPSVAGLREAQEVLSEDELAAYYAELSYELRAEPVSALRFPPEYISLIHGAARKSAPGEIEAKNAAAAADHSVPPNRGNAATILSVGAAALVALAMLLAMWLTTGSSCADYPQKTLAGSYVLAGCSNAAP